MVENKFAIDIEDIFNEEMMIQLYTAHEMGYKMAASASILVTASCNIYGKVEKFLIHLAIALSHRELKRFFTKASRMHESRCSHIDFLCEMDS
ncbi:hypothetical protein CEXT_52791 [Caerostris extrusa]|uniref:Uncharacterized protein n=1 Tax=Caerostris extrusa TaxID=172846 RepID=A0AAV4U8Q8_CAEEX|nr:hypothetical protein CEXT_52791 [Caerostris extrusa]